MKDSIMDSAGNIFSQMTNGDTRVFNLQNLC